MNHVCDCRLVGQKVGLANVQQSWTRSSVDCSESCKNTALYVTFALWTILQCWQIVELCHGPWWYTLLIHMTVLVAIALWASSVRFSRCYCQTVGCWNDQWYVVTSWLEWSMACGNCLTVQSSDYLFVDKSTAELTVNWCANCCVCSTVFTMVTNSNWWVWVCLEILCSVGVCAIL